MPPALDRLAASPSARRLLLLRSFSPNSTRAACSAYSTYPPTRRVGPSNPRRGSPPKWQRWAQPAESAELASRNKVLQSLLLTADAKPNPNSTFHTADAPEDPDAAWAATLAYQERHAGFQGIEAVWSSICDEGYRLPTTDSPHAEVLWGTFVKNSLLVPRVIDHAVTLLRDTNQRYPRLWELMIGFWLPRNTEKTLDYHHQLLVKLRLRSFPLRDLLRSKHSQFQPRTYETLMEIYRSSNERNIYDDVVRPLVDEGRIIEARSWHNLCILRGDLPSPSMAAHPVVQLFMAGSSTSTSRSGFGHQPIHEQTTIRHNQELMLRLVGPDTAPVRFDDGFCARMFATHAFSPDSVIKGLALAGINEIGPEALRAMALRTTPLTELPERFHELRAAGIRLRGSVFSLALEKFVGEDKWDLVDSMLNTDQHPDVFDNAEMQRSLLKYYMHHGDWKQAQRTLAILTLFHNNPSHEAWNMMLQLQITSSSPLQLMDVLNDMRLHGVMVSDESIIAISGLLRPRKIGRKPSSLRSGALDDLRFVSRVYMTILEAGMARLSPFAWREIIRRFGITGRIRELRRLLLWLVGWYAPPGSFEFPHLPRSPFHALATERLRRSFPSRSHYFHFPPHVGQEIAPRHPVRQLVPPSLQQGLIVWGFRAGLMPSATLEQSLFGIDAARRYRRKWVQRGALRRVDWSIGLRILVQLRNLGLFVHPATVCKALRMQFIVLFGYGRSNIKANRIVERANKMDYAYYVRQVNAIWGTRLFIEPRTLARSKLHRLSWHPRMSRDLWLSVGNVPYVSLNDALGSARRRRGPREMQRKGSVDPDAYDVVLKDIRHVYKTQGYAQRRRPEGDTMGERETISAAGDVFGLAFKSAEDTSGIPFSVHERSDDEDAFGEPDFDENEFDAADRHNK